MTVVYGNRLLCIKGFEPGETGKERDISVKEKGFPFLSEKANQPLEHRCNIPLIKFSLAKWF